MKLIEAVQEKYKALPEDPEMRVLTAFAEEHEYPFIARLELQEKTLVDEQLGRFLEYRFRQLAEFFKNEFGISISETAESEREFKVRPKGLFSRFKPFKKAVTAKDYLDLALEVTWVKIRDEIAALFHSDPRVRPSVPELQILLEDLRDQVAAIRRLTMLQK